MWKSVIGSSSIMSFALLGDSLIYAILPVYAETFGLTFVMVGVLLSINRFVRVLTYGIINNLINKFGKKNMCILAAVLATLSTATYGLSLGFIPLFIARIVWGIAYSILVLSTLFYAVEYKQKAGTRVGISQSIQRIGSILSLLVGTWYVTYVGPEMIFIIMAIPTSLGIFIAFFLPKEKIKENKDNSYKFQFKKPNSFECLYFLQGYGVDGLFAITVTLMLVEQTQLNLAVLGGGALLALRHFGEAIASPIFGTIADYIGARKVFIISCILVVVGFLLISIEMIVTGAIILLIFRGAMASLGPALIAQSINNDNKVKNDLSRMQTFRDLGAAIGPIVTGATLSYFSPEIQHLILGTIFTVFFIFFLNSNTFKESIYSIK
jgi:MFS family permease